MSATSSSPRRNIWVDVSTLLRWQGKWTGVPRTIACLLQEWLKDPHDIRLCRFEPSLPGFLEIPIELVQQLFDEQDRQAQLPPQGALTAQGAGGDAEGLLRWAWHRLPGNLREALGASWLAAKHWYRCGRACGRWAVSTPAELCRRVIRAAASSRPERRLFQPGDILLSPGGSWEYTDYLDVTARHRQVDHVLVAALIYDLIPHRFPQFFPSFFPALFQKWLTQLLRLTDQAFTISRCTHSDLLDFATQQQLPMPPCEVIRLGDCLPVRGAVQAPWIADAGGLCPTPFVLIVGTVEVRKNHALIYQVWRHLIEEHGTAVPPLVIAGQSGWLCNELQAQIRHDPRVQGRILFARGLTDGELTWLYQNCLFTVYPSHYEGWGLPVGESLAHGKYCIASSSSSLPEIAGALISYHHPLDFATCKSLVAQAIFDESYRHEREQTIRRCYRTARWSDSAAVLWTGLQQMADRRQRAHHRCA